MAFSRSQYCHTKANSVKTTDMRTAKVKRAESLRAISLACALILPRRSLRPEPPSEREDSPSLSETTDAVSTGSASGCSERKRSAASATSDAVTFSSSCPATMSIRSESPLSTDGSLSLSQTALPAICRADARSRTVRSPGVEKKLLLRRSYMPPLSLRQRASSSADDAVPPERTDSQHVDTWAHMAFRPSWQVLACLFLLISTLSATMKTDPATRASTLTGRSSADTGTDSMNAYPSRNGKCIGDLRSWVVM